jgi:hypothetical protein
MIQAPETFEFSGQKWHKCHKAFMTHPFTDGRNTAMAGSLALSECPADLVRLPNVAGGASTENMSRATSAFFEYCFDLVTHLATRQRPANPNYLL